MEAYRGAHHPFDGSAYAYSTAQERAEGEAVIAGRLGSSFKCIGVPT